MLSLRRTHVACAPSCIGRSLFRLFLFLLRSNSGSLSRPTSGEITIQDVLICRRKRGRPPLGRVCRHALDWTPRDRNAKGNRVVLIQDLHVIRNDVQVVDERVLEQRQHALPSWACGIVSQLEAKRSIRLGIQEEYRFYI